ncbi:MAG TPA: hypothetical protein VK933_05130 [Longimicrobiales bacterium]|nr:hypothetical protein [Longimicrobiales bacterium]
MAQRSCVLWRVTVLVSLLATVYCSNVAGPAGNEQRTYRLGFSATPPRLSIESVLATIDAWQPYADIAQVTQSVPWRALLADTAAADLVQRDLVQLAALYRSRGLPLIVQIDVTDGLARDREAPELVALGRSIREPDVQQRYLDYLLAVDSLLHPEYLGLAMETNLVRAVAPATLYDALRSMVNTGASALAARGSTARTFVSVQVETAWGRLPATGTFEGIAADRRDFAFAEALGLSSYPFLGGFQEPADVPLDYYARLNAPGDEPLPLLVVEGGWSSASVAGVTSSPERQAAWIRRQMELADSAGAIAVTQITFTDLDLSTYPAPPGSILPLFAHLGLVDTDFAPKPALGEWARAMTRPLANP